TSSSGVRLGQRPQPHQKLDLSLLPRRRLPILRRPSKQDTLRRPRRHRRHRRLHFTVLIVLHLVPATSPQYPRLHGRHHLPHCHISISPIPQQYLSDMRRGEGTARPHAAVRDLHQRVGFQTQVVLHQGSERRGSTSAEADVDVHTAAPEKSRVNVDFVVCGEHYDPLFSAA
ncbi:hypothetical protein PanWU01x14_089310, partial [Parasponia andersonii]